MARYALIKDGIVERVIIAEPEILPELDLDADELVKIASNRSIGPGDAYDGATFTKAPEPEPVEKGPTLEERLAQLEAKVQTIEEPLK